jgi:hypothetical protein
MTATGKKYNVRLELEVEAPNHTEAVAKFFVKIFTAITSHQTRPLVEMIRYQEVTE